MINRSSFALLAILVLAVGPGRAATVDAVVKSIAGTAEAAGPGSSRYAPLKVGQHLPIGSTVRTEEESSVILVTTPGSAIDIGPEAILKIDDLAFAASDGSVTQRKARLELTSGSVSAMIDPRTPRITDFKIQTPQGVAAARGTFYAVIIRHGKTYVAVDHGRVGVLADQ